MPAIRLLADQLINQIAAGEVIERPAAALKELLENSLDAGARGIDVELAGGGIKLIRVADDGEGIEREDLRSPWRGTPPPRSPRRPTWPRLRRWDSAARHWPSIAAVSRLSLASRSRERPHAWRIEVDGGEVGVPQPAALAAGTTVTVPELYFNTPARRKFLRTEGTEYGHCEAIWRRIALSHPEVAFTLSHNGTVRQRLLAAGRRTRVDALLGDSFAAQGAGVDVAGAGIALAGWAVRRRTPPPARSRATSICSSTAALCATACSRTPCASVSRRAA